MRPGENENRTSSLNPHLDGCLQADPMARYRDVPVKEPLLFVMDDEYLSVTIGPSGIVAAQIPIKIRTWADSQILRLETILTHIESRQEIWAGSANVTFLGAGVSVEVQRRNIAVRVNRAKQELRELLQEAK